MSEERVIVDTNEVPTLVIEEHDFQDAMSSIKKYSEQTREEVGLSKVPNNGGLFNLVNHKVTGEELNEITSQIQNYLIHLNELGQGLVEEFVQVYKAFESLDKDYIAGIVTSIKAAEAVSKREQEDRKDIKRMIVQHEQSVKVLRKFKEDIDKLKHLTDIDEAWNMLEKQTALSNELSAYMNRLSKLKHLEDIDTLWGRNEKLDKDIAAIQKTLASHDESLSDFNQALQNAEEAQQQFIDNANQTLTESRDDFKEQVKTFTDAQTAALDAIALKQTDSFDKLRAEQTEKLTVIENQQSQKLADWTDNQSAVLERNTKEQEKWLAITKKAFDEEKAALSEQVNMLTQKVKIANYVAGGAAVLTVIQLLWNLLGGM